MEERAFEPYHLTQTLRPTYPAGSCRVQFSPDGSILAVGSNRTVFNNQFTCNIDGIIDFSFSPDGQFLAISSIDSTICIWGVSTRSPVRTLVGHSGAVNCVKFHPRSIMIASASFDDTIRIWDEGSGACWMVISAELGGICTMDISPNGRMIVAGGVRGGCKIWNAETGNVMITIKEHGPSVVGSVMFSSDGKFILIGFPDSSLRMWSMDHELFTTIYCGHENRISRILSTFIRANERYIVSGSEDKCLYIWEVTSGRLVQRIDRAHAAAVQSVTSHPTRNVIASMSLRDLEIVKVWAQNPS